MLNESKVRTISLNKNEMYWVNETGANIFMTPSADDCQVVDR